MQEKQKVRNPSVLKPPELKKYTLCKDMLQQILSQTTAIITSSLHLSKTMQEVDSRILFAHPIKSAYFMKKIVEGLSNVREIKEVSELFDGFKGVVSKVKDRGVECVGEAWLLGKNKNKIKNIYLLLFLSIRSEILLLVRRLGIHKHNQIRNNHYDNRKTLPSCM